MKYIKLTCANILTPETTGDKDAVLLVRDSTAYSMVAASLALLSDAVGNLVPHPGVGLDDWEDHIDETPTVAETKKAEKNKEPLPVPYGNASEAAWVEYAMSVDPKLTKDEAFSMTKAQLQSEYGERL